jgi:hypothetical protein
MDSLRLWRENREAEDRLIRGVITDQHFFRWHSVHTWGEDRNCRLIHLRTTICGRVFAQVPRGSDSKEWRDLRRQNANRVAPVNCYGSKSGHITRTRTIDTENKPTYRGRSTIWTGAVADSEDWIPLRDCRT